MNKFLPGILISMAMIFPSCHVARYFYLNYADINDYKRFPACGINKPVNSFHFKTSRFTHELFLPYKYMAVSGYHDFESFLEVNKTLAFLVVKNDTIVYEHYFNGYSAESVFPGFSIAKSFISALIGIAIGDGLIQSEKERITAYLTEFKHPGFDKISIENLLNMQSGIKFKESYYSPFGGMARFYYGTNLKRYICNLKTETEPGITFNYQSANTQILHMILEKATGINTAEYLQKKIWVPLGMEYNATWNIDSKKNRNIKAFCCINARARDFAKFGRLYLENGIWNGNQIIPAEWITKTKNYNPDFRDGMHYPYHYHWRVLENGDMFAKGILGQYIYISPGEKLIFVRIGKKNGEIDWPSFFMELKPQFK